MTRRQPTLCCSLIATIVMACGPTEESNTPTENQTSREVFEDTWSATIEAWGSVEGTDLRSLLSTPLLLLRDSSL